MPRTHTIRPPASPTSVRARLRALLAADGRNQSEVAHVAAMSPSQLSNTLLGVKANPSIDSVARVLAALGRSWIDLDCELPADDLIMLDAITADLARITRTAPDRTRVIRWAVRELYERLALARECGGAAPTFTLPGPVTSPPE